MDIINVREIKKKIVIFVRFTKKQCYYGNIIDNKNLIMDENSI